MLIELKNVPWHNFRLYLNCKEKCIDPSIGEPLHHSACTALKHPFALTTRDHNNYKVTWDLALKDALPGTGRPNLDEGTPKQIRQDKPKVWDDKVDPAISRLTQAQAFCSAWSTYCDVVGKRRSFNFACKPGRFSLNSSPHPRQRHPDGRRGCSACRIVRVLS